MSAELQLLRANRDAKLMNSDWTQLVDAPLTDSKKAEWVTYRQALRDITKTYTNMEDDGFAFPAEPS
tara:strand:- start:874 stop:1074 length:201 start_codon:yes stop_codon:yes gene_type:complete